MPKQQKKRGGKNRDKRNEVVGTECWFCSNTAQPDYKEVEVLRVFLSPRGKILPRRTTGTCAKHQRDLSGSIKQARQVALIR
ncbi:30S ribosomal protein S18 [candidate division WWE3 bacterium]|nr:30S ribosomal protein S18 [candidate division WWE3 bacterium]